ncbi:hypothetical protein ACFYS8_05710 [Kitasatospora sp. NPDC004615]|uniref:SCO6745 family protein n=1 Tax=Kitasatospora sp. NPDC004615 TaxID=3364017 RepID=UPI0036A26DDE
MTPIPLSPLAGRRCQEALNALHSTVYFSPDFAESLAEYGVDDSMAVYLAGRAGPLGPVAAGTVTAAFYGFAHPLIAEHLPHVWSLVPPATVVELRLAAVDALLRRHLGEETLASAGMAEAARLALSAAGAGQRAGRPMFSAHADQPVPQEPHLALWYAATLLREHRGDAHIAALQHAELDGIDALVSHCASGDGMPKEVVMTKRGWTEADWSAAEDRLRERGLMDADGALTAHGELLRTQLEAETDRLDRAPYEHLGAESVARLTELAESFTAQAAASGAFPPELLAFFGKR